MILDKATYELLNDETRLALLKRVLSIFIPISVLVAATGMLTNLLGPFHAYRFTLNLIGSFILIGVWRLIRSERVIEALTLLTLGMGAIFITSTLVNGGVRIPNYVGLLVVLVVLGVFSSRRLTAITYLIFVTVGGLSILSHEHLVPAEQITYPSEFRYWTIYTCFGLLIISLLSLVRQTLSDTIERLAAQRALLSSILNSTSDALIVFDERAEVIHKSASAVMLEERLHDEAQDPNLVLINHVMFNLDTQESAPLLELLKSAGAISGELTLRAEPQTLNLQLSVGHKQRWLSVTASPRVYNESIAGTVVSIRDISDRHRLLQTQKMSAVSSLANGVAHDFNNMLSAIRSATDLLALDLDEEQAELLEMIDEATGRSAELIQQLRLFSRAQTSHASHQAQVFDLHELLHKVGEVLRRVAIAEHTVIFELTAARSIIKGDRAQLHSALINLGVNALQAMEGGGQLTLRSTNQLKSAPLLDQPRDIIDAKMSAAEVICVEVRDEGVGIPHEIIDRVFEPFFTTRGVGGGTGLGLAGVHGAMQRHQGSIHLQTERGVGTSFFITLPLFSDIERQISGQISGEISDDLSAQTLHQEPAYKRLIKRALIIDDEPLVRRGLCAQLSSLGISVDDADSGDAGLARLYESLDEGASYDVVILDMLMPEKNGDEVFYEIQSVRPELPVIISSGFAPDGLIAELLSCGLAGTLDKPYRLAELVDVLSRVALASQDREDGNRRDVE